MKYQIECKAAGFYDRDLARFLATEDFQALLLAKIAIMQAKMQLELEDQMKEQLAEELGRLAGLDERARKVLMARKHVEEEILQMKCPRCKTAFYDFEAAALPSAAARAHASFAAGVCTTVLAVMLTRTYVRAPRCRGESMPYFHRCPLCVEPLR